MAKFAHFCETNLLRTRNRDYPPSKDEVIACLVSTYTGYYVKCVLAHDAMYGDLKLPYRLIFVALFRQKWNSGMH